MTKNLLILLLLFTTVLFLTLYIKERKLPSIDPLATATKPREKPLDGYTIQALRKREFKPSPVTFGRVVQDHENYTSRIFYYNESGKKVSGFANIPKNAGTIPLIVQIRGFVPQNIFESGVGTRHSGEVFADNGMMTLAPDFLGYGESDNPPPILFADRFETYTTVLTLLASIDQVNEALKKENYRTQIDPNKVGIWGHSNGGQITLTVLEITSKSYPTVLWAPVSKPFPWSILYFTDIDEDHGRSMRKAVADFEKDYNAENYSLVNFFDYIKAPVQLQQGTADEAVPQKWSDDLYNELKKRGIDITYYVYQGEDHNFAQGNWATLVKRDIAFYKDHFGQ